MNRPVILGTLLGDAWVQKVTKRSNSYQFSFSQSIKEYALWKAEMLNLPYTIYERHRFDKRTNKTYYSCQVLVKLDKIEKENLYNLFYKPKKQVDSTILNQLTDLSVAVWFMDDGSLYYNGNNCHLILAVDGFTEPEQLLVKAWFKNKYDINFTKTKTNIRLTSKKECVKFMNIVEQYIPECMRYKTLNKALEKYHNNLTEEKRNRRWKRNR